jgi:hypothetical protein
MAFPHQDPREDHGGKVEVSEEMGIRLNLLRRTIDIADQGNAESNVNPAKNGTFGDVFHDFRYDLVMINENGPPS